MQMTKKMLALILAVLLAFGTFAMNVCAEEDEWDGTVPTSAPSGYDETASPITLDTAEEFVWFFNRVGNNTNFDGKTVVLTTDIDLGGHDFGIVWQTAGYTFNGMFDGQNHTVSNFTFASSGQSYRWSLFRNVKNATIQNLYFENVNISGGYGYGHAALVGMTQGDVTIENVQVNSGSVSGGIAVAGVVGQNKAADLTIRNCSNAASITATTLNAGGIVGASTNDSDANTAITVENCTNTGDVTAVGGYASGIYGVIAPTSAKPTVSFKNCANEGTLTAFEGTDDICAYCVVPMSITSTASDAVIALIDAIGDVAYTTACKDKIDAARTAYNALTDAQKKLVTNYTTLTDAEETYAALAPAIYTKDSEGIADGVILANPGETIDTTGTSGNLFFNNQIDVDYYNNGLSMFSCYYGRTWSGVDSLFINDNNEFICYNWEDTSKFTADEGMTFKVSYDAEKDLWRIFEVDAVTHEAPQMVIYTKDSEGIANGLILENAGEIIDTANTSQYLVFDSSIHADTYNDGRELFAYKAGEIINGVDTFFVNDNNEFICYNWGCTTKLTPADGMALKVSYDSANDLWHIAEFDPSAPAVEAVMSLIDAIGTVEYTPESKAKIDAAREAYDALTDAQKALVSNYTALTDAEEALKAAAPKAICLVTDVKADNILGAQQSNVWFGNYKQSGNWADGYKVDPIKWRVLSNADGKLFLLSDQILECISDVFVASYGYWFNNWEESTLRKWLNGLGRKFSTANFKDNAFSQAEYAAVAITDIASERDLVTQSPNYDSGSDTQDKMFVLSLAEATNPDYGFTNNLDATETRAATTTPYSAEAESWYLRTGSSLIGEQASYVESASGSVITEVGAWYMPGYDGVRPALNIDLGKVLFTSAAVGGKLDEIVKNDDNKPMMSAVGNYAGSDWKLTVLDESRSNFDVHCLSFKDGICRISYSNATGQIDDRISGMIVDADGNVKYYGVLGYANPATTRFGFDVSGQYEVGDRIYIFNEEVHGDKQTDYSSRLIDITPEKLPEGITATIGQTLADVVIPNPDGNTDGTWTWDDPSTPVGTEGEYTFAATFTPEDTSLFDIVHTNLTVTVAPAPAAPQDWQSVTIDDQIRINFLLDLDAREGFRNVTIEYVDQDKNETVRTLVYNDVKKLEKTEDGRYRIPVILAPAQIGDTVKATIHADSNGGEYTTSIQAYCTKLIESDCSEEVKKLAKAILEYGQAANDYFARKDLYHTSQITTIEDAANAEKIEEAQGLENHMSVVTGGKINAVSFMALTQPEFRFYTTGLTEEEAAELNQKIHVTTGNAKAQFVKNVDTDAIMLEVTGIEAAGMDEVIGIEIDGFGTIRFCGNDFARMLAKNDSTKTLGTALYLYGLAAKAYFA